MYSTDDLIEYRFEKFRDFVNTTLLLREETDLHKFRLSCSLSHDDQYHMFGRSWVLYALKHNLQVLDIDIRLPDIYFDMLPLGSITFGIFTCASLVDVYLSSLNTPLQSIKLINLPCLRRLHLYEIRLNQDFIDKLFCGCPVLEVFYLEFCCAEFSSINSQSLKYLNIQSGCHRNPEEVRLELINAPNLLSFCYSMCLHVVGHKMILKMPSLSSASIYYNCIHKGRSCSDIFIGLSEVHSLKLSGYRLRELLENELPNCPEFSNVKDLSLIHICLCCDFNLFAALLDHFPNLEKLSLQHICENFQADLYREQDSLKIAPFKGKGLETIDVKFLRGDKCFPWGLKYLEDFTEKSSAQINITGLNLWSSPDRYLDMVFQH